MQKDVKELRAQVRNEIRAIHPDKFNLSRKEFATLAGVTTGHISNCEAVHKRPLVAPVFEGRKVLYPITDVVEYLVNQRLKSTKPKLGARTKADRIAAEGGV